MKSSVCCILVTFLVTGCRSSHEEKRSDNSSHDTMHQAPPPYTSPPAGIVQNVSQVEAVVENIQPIDAVQFDIVIFIISSTPAAGRTSIVEAGQRMVVAPQFVIDPRGDVDMTSETNRRLLTIKGKQPGQSFKGKISMNRQGSWDLVDVDQEK